jgi:hypothetical protein
MEGVGGGMRVVDVHRHRLQVAEPPPHLLQEVIVLVEQTELAAVLGELPLRFAIRTCWYAIRSPRGCCSCCNRSE